MAPSELVDLDFPDWPRFLGFLLAIVEAHGYVYIVNDMHRLRANEKSGFHSSVSMKELPHAATMQRKNILITCQEAGCQWFRCWSCVAWHLPLLNTGSNRKSVPLHSKLQLVTLTKTHKHRIAGCQQKWHESASIIYSENHMSKEIRLLFMGTFRLNNLTSTMPDTRTVCLQPYVSSWGVVGSEYAMIYKLWEEFI